MIPAPGPVPIGTCAGPDLAASSLGPNEETLCHGIRGPCIIDVDGKAARQRYATETVQTWQARYSLPFTDLLALFRLAGKTYDRAM